LNYNYVKISQFRRILWDTARSICRRRSHSSLAATPPCRVRFDLLNAFNTRNYAQLFDGYPGKPFYFTDGNLYGVPRTVKVA